MYRDKERYGQDPTRVHRSSKATFDAPLRWQREAERGDRVGHDRLVFTCSWSDWFIEEADAWRDDAWAIVKACPLLTFQVLTKRIERAAGRFPSDWGDGYPNCWGGVSVEDQAAAGARIPRLLKTPWVLRYLSVEPLLAPVDLTAVRHSLGAESFEIASVLQGDDGFGLNAPRNRVDWAIIGGESGNDTGKYRARPCNVDWIRDLVRQCRSAKVPAWVKQLGSNPYVVRDNENSTTDPGDEVPVRLKDRHGEDWSEFPADLRVWQMPAVAEVTPR